MPISPYIRQLREHIGHALLLMPSVTIIIFDEQGRVLLAQHTEGGNWLLPGGSVEPDETPAQAAVREIWEETSLQVALSHIIGVYGGPEFQVTYANGDTLSYLGTAFEARVITGQPQPDGEETLALAYFSEQALASMPMPAWMRIVLKDAFRRDGRTHFQAPTWQPPADGIRKGGISDYMAGLRRLVGHQLVSMPGAGAIIFNDQGEVLLQQRADNGHWNPPAGALDPHETPADAVVREVWEETGLLVEPLRITGVYSGSSFYATYPNGDQIAVYSIVFECRIVGGQLSLDEHESLDLRFFPVEALTGDFLPPRWQRRFADALRPQLSAHFQR